MFSKVAKYISKIAGHSAVFSVMLLCILIWLATGKYFHFSDTWQLVINTATSVITFLMVFIIQNSQNRDTVSIQIKLDELIRSLEGAHNRLVDLENLSEEEIEQIHKKYEALSKKIHTREDGNDQGTPDV